MMINTFFVYGTLRPDESRWGMLKEYALKIEPGILYGARLYTTGPWPFVVLGGAGDVYGELITVPEAHIALITRMLDQVEGYSELAPRDENLFVRITHPIYSSLGYPDQDGYVEASLYIASDTLAASATDTRRILSGDWKKRHDSE